MSERQRETIEWLGELEQYAKEKQLSMRILDSIEECRQNVASESVNWDRMNLQIEELLESIGKKALPETLRVGEDDDEVSVEAVENEMKNMMRRCHAENEASVNNIAKRKNIITKTLFIKLQEITRIRAHLEEMKNEDLYLVFFQRARGEYHNNILALLREMLQDISSNYGHMMERMRNMLHGIGAYKHGLSNEKLYSEYDTRKGGLESKIQNEMEVLETGGEEILDFGRRTGEVITSTVQKLEKKRKKIARIPIIIAMCILLGGAALVYTQMSNAVKGAQEKLEENTDDTLPRDVRMMAEDLMEIRDLLGGSAASAGAYSVAIYAVFIILVFAVFYLFYLLILKLWCKNQICKKCGLYLKAELAVFEQNNTLLFQMNDVINTAVEEYEQQFVALLNDILAGTRYDPDSEEKKVADQFAEIRNRWNAIKYQ